MLRGFGGERKLTYKFNTENLLPPQVKLSVLQGRLMPALALKGGLQPAARFCKISNARRVLPSSASGKAPLAMLNTLDSAMACAITLVPLSNLARFSTHFFFTT